MHPITQLTILMQGVAFGPTRPSFIILLLQYPSQALTLSELTSLLSATLDSTRYTTPLHRRADPHHHRNFSCELRYPHYHPSPLPTHRLA